MDLIVIMILGLMVVAVRSSLLNSHQRNARDWITWPNKKNFSEGIIEQSPSFLSETHLFLYFYRKLKNRVAAQTARDKKKAKMDELEEIVKNLREEVRFIWCFNKNEQHHLMGNYLFLEWTFESW